MSRVVVLLVAFALVHCALGQAGNLPQCTEDDLTGDYTRCLSLNDTRTLFYYYGRCNPEGMPSPPPPVSDLPCDINCEPGSYLPLQATECATCPAGTFSMGGGKRFYQWRDAFPRTSSILFRTYCAEADSISASDAYPYCGWELNGFATDSGDMSGMASVNSILEMSTALLVEGSVQFSYNCDVSHSGDTFAYKLDEERPVPLQVTSEYMTINIPLSAGPHRIRWIFYKDPETGTGNERARLSWVEVYGLKAADDQACPKCPPGGYQPEEGKDVCIKCPANTYMPDEGAVECVPCEDGYSTEGSTSCTPYQRPCTDADAVRFYTPCTHVDGHWVYDAEYRWQTPLVCDNSTATLPTGTQGITCSPCAPGSFFNEASQQCDYCPAGSQTSVTGTCTQCPAGSAAVNEIYYYTWEELSGDFSTFCYGPCLSSGWSPSGDTVRAVLNTEKQVDLLLTLVVDIIYAGSVDYTWAVEGDEGAVEFEVTIDGASVDSHASGHGTNQHVLHYGYHTIGFWAHGSGVGTGTASITQVLVKGSAEGGAPECEPCAPGFFQPAKGQQECLPCSFGHFADAEGATKCEKCEADTFASRSGTSLCLPCPQGTHSTPGAGYCQNPHCTYYTLDGEHAYNLSPYAGVPQYVENGETSAGFYLISYCGLLFEDDTECESAYACETYDKFSPFDTTTDHVSWGTEIVFEEEEDPQEGFALVFQGGDAVGCPTNTTRSMRIEFACAMEQDEYTALELVAPSSDCSVVFQQTSIYGCPVCSGEDFERKEGECEDGTMVVKYPKHKGARCNGSVKDTVESCGDLTLDFGLAVVLGVLVAVAVLSFLTVIVVVVQKNRRLKVKYSQLQASNVELDELDE